MGHNLFDSLFNFRARPGVSPSENFLTEAWGYLLGSRPQLCRKFISRCLGGSVAADAVESPVVETQVTYAHPAGGSCVYPDLRIRFQTTDGRSGELLCEHKWESPTVVEQLRCYATLPGYGVLRRVVFICADPRQRGEAEAWVDQALLWREVHAWLDGSDDGADTILREFREFLRLHALAVREVAPSSAELNETYGEVMAAQMANARFAWDALPARLRECRRLMGPRKRQVGIDFGDAAGPIFFAGYFLTGCDQPVEMCNPDGGIDLVLAFFRKPGRDLPWEAVAGMERRLRAYDADLSVRSGKQARNSWIVLSVRKSLAEVAPAMKADEAETALTYAMLHSWCRVIFADADVEREMRRVWPDGW